MKPLKIKFHRTFEHTVPPWDVRACVYVCDLYVSCFLGITVATLTPVKYFGEYGVFADEPRAASLLCVGRVGQPRDLSRNPVPLYRVSV